jgi:hypothetical protein
LALPLPISPIEKTGNSLYQCDPGKANTMPFSSIAASQQQGGKSHRPSQLCQRAPRHPNHRPSDPSLSFRRAGTADSKKPSPPSSDEFPPFHSIASAAWLGKGRTFVHPVPEFED